MRTLQRHQTPFCLRFLEAAAAHQSSSVTVGGTEPGNQMTDVWQRANLLGINNLQA